MREPENIEALLALRVDLIGFIFFKGSPRYVGRNKLDKWIGSHLARFGETRRVGVFVNAEVDAVLNAVHDYQLDYAQLHGVESPEYCFELLDLWKMGSLRSARLIKAFPVDAEFDFSITEAYAPHCSHFLFDTKTPAHGGSGLRFDWSLLDRYNGETPFLLSGGIGPEAAEAIRNISHPQLAGVDLNSRFEISPGRKNIERIEQFVHALKSS